MLTRNRILDNRYKVRGLLAKGGQGRVYEALDTKLKCLVAIKELHTDTGDEKLRKQFEREGDLLGNLCYSALPTVIDIFSEKVPDSDNEKKFIVMKFIEGTDFKRLLAKRKAAFPWAEVSLWMMRILSALHYLHTRKIPVIHRDIKPSNLKLTAQGEVYLLDFGLAKGAAGLMQTPATALKSSTVHGFTEPYAPLEQLNGSATNEQSDIYSFGATFYHLLTYRAPMSAKKRYEEFDMTGRDPLPLAHEVNPDVPLHVSKVLSRAMSISRKDRYASAAEMSEALNGEGSELEKKDRQADDESVTVVRAVKNKKKIIVEPVPEQRVGNKRRVLTFAAISVLLVLAISSAIIIGLGRKPKLNVAQSYISRGFDYDFRKPEPPPAPPANPEVQPPQADDDESDDPVPENQDDVVNPQTPTPQPRRGASQRPPKRNSKYLASLLRLDAHFQLPTGKSERKSNLYKSRKSYNKALADTKGGRYQEAAANFKKAIELSPDFFQARLNMSTSHAILGNYNEAFKELDNAEEAFKRAFPSKRYYPEAVFNRGVLHLYLNDKVKAQKEQVKLKKLNSELAEELSELIQPGVRAKMKVKQPDNGRRRDEQKGREDSSSKRRVNGGGKLYPRQPMLKHKRKL